MPFDFFVRKSNKTIKPKDNYEIQLWEENYLVKKIKSQFVDIPEDVIRVAVKACYIKYRSPQSGEKLVQCVISTLQSNSIIS